MKNFISYYLFSALVLTSACSGPSYKADHSLIQSWSTTLNSDAPRMPFVAEYSREGRSLSYLAARHENSQNSVTLQLINQTLAAHKFDIVLLEGFPRSRGESPKSMVSWSLKDGKNGFYEGGETSFSIQLAQKQNIPFIGAEPDESEIEAEVVKAGYTKQDLLLFYFVRQIPEFRREHKLKNSNIESLSEDFMQYWTKALNVSQMPTYQSFLSWYQEKNGIPFRADEINTEAVAPYSDSPLFNHKISTLIDRIRNAYIVDQIAEALRKYKNVLIIYGSGHWTTQQNAIEDMVGKPTISLLSPGNCRKRIETILCLAPAPKKESDRYKDGRPCLEGADQYLAEVLDAYDRYPSRVQSEICGLKKFYIEKNGIGPAWSGLDDDNDPGSGMIGLRKAELDANVGLEQYNSWFEQQSFTESKDFTAKPDLPNVKVSFEKNQTASWLTYTLLHETGHIIDYKRKFDDEKCGSGCKPSPTSWTTISWLDASHPRPEADFEMRSSICLNNCKGKFISSKNATRLYDSIYAHGFISQLAALNPMEDFAESFATYIAAEQMGIHFVVQANKGTRYNLDDVLKSKPFAPKLAFLRKEFPE